MEVISKSSVAMVGSQKISNTTQSVNQVQVQVQHYVYIETITPIQIQDQHQIIQQETQDCNQVLKL